VFSPLCAELVLRDGASLSSGRTMLSASEVSAVELRRCLLAGGEGVSSELRQVSSEDVKLDILNKSVECAEP
jgi:hypothetical protein